MPVELTIAALKKELLAVSFPLKVAGPETVKPVKLLGAIEELAPAWAANRVPAPVEPQEKLSAKAVPFTVLPTELTTSWLGLVPPFNLTEVVPTDVGPSITLPEAVSAPEMVWWPMHRRVPRP
jgi:hypothetical protein